MYNMLQHVITTVSSSWLLSQTQRENWRKSSTSWINFLKKKQQKNPEIISYLNMDILVKKMGAVTCLLHFSGRRCDNSRTGVKQPWGRFISVLFKNVDPGRGFFFLSCCDPERKLDEETWCAADLVPPKAGNIEDSVCYLLSSLQKHPNVTNVAEHRTNQLVTVCRAASLQL